MKTFIVVKAQFEGMHQWLNCPYSQVSFLKDLHRHIFYVEVVLGVYGDDRELEFFMVKKDLEKIIQVYLEPPNLGNQSCEMMAKEIAQGFKNYGYKTLFKVSVFEDNENGSVIFEEDTYV